MNLSPDLLLRAYAMGVFPMADSRHARDVHFVEPRFRGIFDLYNFHISRSLRRDILNMAYTIRTNSDFVGVIDACADRAETWINPAIRAAYLDLHAIGHAHSLEVWDEAEGLLIGGVYGVTLGAAFFGESMFSRRTSGSKIALAWLMHRLRAGGFQLFDTQFLTPHLASLGAVEIPQADYLIRLEKALAGTARFDPPGYQPLPSSVVAAPSSPSAGSSAG